MAMAHCIVYQYVTMTKTKMITTKQSKNNKQIAKTNKEDTDRDTKRGKRERRKEGKKEEENKGRERGQKGPGGEGGVYSIGEMYSISCMAVVV